MNNYIDDIKEIRSIMDRTTRFNSISSYSIILVGIYAIIGYYIARNFIIPTGSKMLMTILALSVAAISIGTVSYFMFVKIKRSGEGYNRTTLKALIKNLTIPLLFGAVISIILASKGEYHFIPLIHLTFYGLAVFSSSRYTNRYLEPIAYIEMVLGILTLIFPDYTLFLWLMGFGIVHIAYGVFTLVKYKQ